jgi:glycoprotein 3-alpha-L-fucosyltransferase
MTYRQDSDIIHDYGRYIFRNLSYTIHDYQAVDFYLSSKDNQSTFDVQQQFSSRQNKILWFVSNCNTRTKRHKIAEELNKAFPIEQYGQCLNTNKKKSRISTEVFEQTLFNYKFYLAFENSRCQDYITEKAFYNALAHGSIPIVLGPTKENYKQLLPPNSFIHIEDFKSLKDLSTELDHISKDLQLFKSYHQWRIDYRLIVWPSNYYINDRFCDLCVKLYNDKNKSKSYSNFPQWLNQCK